MTAEIKGGLEEIAEYLEGQADLEKEQGKTYGLKTVGDTRVIYEVQRTNTNSREEIRDKTYRPRM